MSIRYLIIHFTIKACSLNQSMPITTTSIVSSKKSSFYKFSFFNVFYCKTFVTYTDDSFFCTTVTRKYIVFCFLYIYLFWMQIFIIFKSFKTLTFQILDCYELFYLEFYFKKTYELKFIIILILILLYLSIIVLFSHWKIIFNNIDFGI